MDFCTQLVVVGPVQKISFQFKILQVKFARQIFLLLKVCKLTKISVNFTALPPCRIRLWFYTCFINIFYVFTDWFLVDFKRKQEKF